MNYSKDTEKVFCHICHKWIDIRTNTYIDDAQVKCLECDAMLGYTHDRPEVYGRDDEG